MSVTAALQSKQVAVICDGERIAMHRRSTSPAGAYVTDPAHMPDSHREWTAWSGDRFRSWAAGKGEAILAVVDGILKSRKVEQQAYRSALPTSTGTRSWKGRAQRRSPGRRAPATRQ